MNSKTRIVATIGPASSSEKILKELLEAGVNVFRLNMSHGTHPEHRTVIERIRRLKTKPGFTPAVMMDLQGPKIRVGRLKAPVTLRNNSRVTITARNISGDNSLIPTTYKNIVRDIHAGDKILLDDGQMELRAEKIVDNGVVCRVKRGGLLKEHKGINLPGVKVSAPSLTKKDMSDLRFGITEKVDYIALSFVRMPKDVKTIKSFLKRSKASIPVIAKIEKPEATNHLEEILDLADGVMVARGDLGVEMSVQKVPILQKRIIQSANRMGKLVITATQMLETMTSNPYPTRAEASDVANAIFDGTDAVMLSEETAAGKYPVQCVRTMRTIAEEAEKSVFSFHTTGNLEAHPGYLPHAVAEAAYHTSVEINHSALVVFSFSGATAIYMSKLRPPTPIIALSPNHHVCRRLALIWGLRALITPFGNNSDEMISLGEKTLLQSGLLKKGQTVIIVGGTTPNIGGTNMIKILKLGAGGK